MRVITKERYNVTNSVTKELIEYQYGIKFEEDGESFTVSIPPGDAENNDAMLACVQDYTNSNNKGWITLEEFEVIQNSEWVDVVVNRDPHLYGGREQPDYVEE
jgi:hypothetical protein